MVTDLHSFPDEYIGRKVYVLVAGDSKSVPKYKTYIGIDGKRHVLPQYGGDGAMMGSDTSHYILPDKLEYQSPMDGSVITSRSTHREHMARHGVVEAGDMKLGSSIGIDRAPMSRAGNDIIRSMEELRSR